MSKILFYTANGVGLGHIRRSSLIAKSILKTDKSSEVFFVSMCENAPFLEEFKIPFEKLIPVSDEIIEDYKENLRCKKINEQKLANVIDKFKPDRIVLDIHVFANFSFPDLLFLEKYKTIEKVLIYRMTNKKSFVKNFDKFTDKFKIFDKIIIPHAKNEIKENLSKKDFEKCLNDPKIKFSGPIFRKINKKALIQCKSDYSLSNENFNITITLGGGGELKKGDCETPAGIILGFLKSYDSLIKKYPKIKIVLVTGPLFKHKKIVNLIKGMYGNKIVIKRFENHLLELISLSNLVISPIGYNAGNEIVEAKTPALFVPLLRGKDNGQEQLERARYFEKFGFARVYSVDSKISFSELLDQCVSDNKNMKTAFKNVPNTKEGNKKSAKIILS